MKLRSRALILLGLTAASLWAPHGETAAAASLEDVAADAIDLFWNVCLTRGEDKPLEDQLDRLGFTYSPFESHEGTYEAWSIVGPRSVALFRLAFTDVVPCIVEVERADFQRGDLSKALELKFHEVRVPFRKGSEGLRDAEGRTFQYSEYVVKLALFTGVPAVRIPLISRTAESEFAGPMMRHFLTVVPEPTGF